jgi:hypothetical protein
MTLVFVRNTTRQLLSYTANGAWNGLWACVPSLIAYFRVLFPWLLRRLLALRDGREPPTMLSSPMLRASSSSGGMSSPAAASPAPATSAGTESPLEREMRLRREAEQRLRDKFGSGGLKGQSVTNSGFGYTPDEPEPAGPEYAAHSSLLSTVRLVCETVCLLSQFEERDGVVFQVFNSCRQWGVSLSRTTSCVFRHLDSVVVMVW